MNRWKLTEDDKVKYTPIITQFLSEVESKDPSNDIMTKDFSDTGLNPSKLQSILENLGYEHTDSDENGWEMDFLINFEKSGCKPVRINGCGMTFELILEESNS